MQIKILNSIGVVTDHTVSFWGLEDSETGDYILLADGKLLGKVAKEGLYILLGDRWHRIEDEGIKDV